MLKTIKGRRSENNNAAKTICLPVKTSDDHMSVPGVLKPGHFRLTSTEQYILQHYVHHFTSHFHSTLHTCATDSGPIQTHAHVKAGRPLHWLGLELTPNR